MPRDYSGLRESLGLARTRSARFFHRTFQRTHLRGTVNRAIPPANLCFPFSRVVDARKRESFILKKQCTRGTKTFKSVPSFYLQAKKKNDSHRIVACVLAPKGNEARSCKSFGEKFDANMRSKDTKEKDQKIRKIRKEQLSRKLAFGTSCFLYTGLKVERAQYEIEIARLGAMEKIKTASQ